MGPVAVCEVKPGTDTPSAESQMKVHKDARTKKKAAVASAASKAAKHKALKVDKIRRVGSTTAKQAHKNNENLYSVFNCAQFLYY